jgi:hypothetical protein
LDLRTSLASSKIICFSDGHCYAKQKQAPMQEWTLRLSKLNALCDSLGIHFLFVLAPTVLHPDDPLHDKSKVNQKNLRLSLAEAKINYLDLRQKFVQESMDSSKEFHHGLFFKTDHHWKPSTALWVSKIVSQEINERFGLGLDTALFLRHRFASKTYPKVFLGSHGRSLLLSDEERDDWTILWPTYPSYFVSIPNGDTLKGNFAGMFLKKQLTHPNDFNQDFYAALLQTISVQNTTQTNTHKLLLTGSSYSTPVGFFQSLAFQWTTVLGHVDASKASEYLIREKPDVFVFLVTEREPADNFAAGSFRLFH